MILGKQTTYKDGYDKELLHPILRISNNTPNCYGYDIWNVYELSWWDARTKKPIVAIATIAYQADSEYLIESKSMKLYLSAFNSSVFASEKEVKELIASDISDKIKSPVFINLYAVNSQGHNLGQINTNIQNFLHTEKTSPCILLDDEDGDCRSLKFEDRLNYITTSSHNARETLYSHLFRSKCPVTSQPDWATAIITYDGPKIDCGGLLRYLVSFRNHQDFHEQCTNRIFNDIMTTCNPKELTVYMRFTRRGGIDINPWRSTLTEKDKLTVHQIPNLRLSRQ